MKWIKSFLKRILPPPVRAFMREVNNILSSINKGKNELRAQIEKLQKEYAAQNNELKRLYELFESANRENLRIFLESKEERENLLAETKNERLQLISEYAERIERYSTILDTAEEKNSRLASLLDEVQTKIYEEQKILIKAVMESREHTKSIDNNVNRLISRVPGRHLYNNDYERRVTASFKEYKQRPDYIEKLLSLLEGLDEESAATVTQILSRQEKIWGTEGKSLDLMTDEEQIKIRYLEQYFKNNIFKITDGIYCYKNFLLPINHFEPSVFVDRYALNLLRNPEYFKFKCIMDVGAYIGDSALILSPLTSSEVFAFEATSKYYNLLLKTLELNKTNNIIPVRKALGAECGKTEIYVADSCSTFLAPNIAPESSEEVEMITLDSFVEQNNLEVGLIKVDIEGYEREFLKGAEKTIRTQRPTLLISIYHYAGDFFEIKPTIENWNLGYTFKIHKPVDYSISREVLLLGEIEK